MRRSPASAIFGTLCPKVKSRLLIANVIYLCSYEWQNGKSKFCITYSVCIGGVELNILIIGNGFDLAHGLPTKYEHFLKYANAFIRFRDICKQESIKEEYDAADGEDKEFIIYFANLYQKKKAVFEEIDALISNNVWINYFWEIYKGREVAGKDGWIDFENEISRIIQTLDQARHAILGEISQGHKLGKMTQQQLNILSPIFGMPKISRDGIDFDENAVEYRKVQLLKDLNRLTRCLEIYLYNYVEEITPKVKLPDIDRLNIHCVLSFNYTHTYEKFYDMDKSSKIKYDYIHGETRADSTIDNCNLILGIDEYLEGYAKNRDNEFIQFKKFYQRIYKKTGCKYVDWVNSIAQFPSGYGRNGDAIHNVYIIGHSLDITDKDILSSLINMKSTKTTIFYHSQTTLGNQISNLVKVLGEDELIARVHGENASIVLQKQKEPISIEH